MTDARMITPLVILHEAQMGENIGMSARAMLNCGFHDLRLSAPRDGWSNAQAMATSAGATQILGCAEIFDNLDEAIKDCGYIVALSARPRNRQLPCYDLAEAVAEIYHQTQKGVKTAILFGGERAGLDNQAICRANAIASITLNPDYCSLNLSQAVLLFAYHYHAYHTEQQKTQAQTSLDSNLTTPTLTPPATRDALENFFSRLENRLEESGFFTAPDKKTEMLLNLRSFFTRAAPSMQELQTLHGIIHKLKSHTPKK